MSAEATSATDAGAPSVSRADGLPSDVPRLYPYRGATIEVEGKYKLHYVDEGRGSPILFVHGNPTWSFYWRNLINGLSDRHRCVAVDHLGCGLSDKPDDHPYTIASHIEHLDTLVRTLDLRDITLVVHDWGGPIGFGAALKEPWRYRRFVVFNTGLFLGPCPPSIRMCRVPLLGDVLIQGLNGFVRVGLFRAIADRSRLAGAVGNGFLAPYDSWAHRRAQLRFIQEIPLDPAHPNWELIQGIDQGTASLQDRPMLIAWGEQDFCFTPWFREEMQKRFPTAEVHAWQDASHWVIEDQPERVLALVNDFLAKHPIAPAA